MKKQLHFLFAALFACDALSLSHADVVPAPLFKHRAVLQRDKPIPVWGRADAGERVTVGFAGRSVTTIAGDDGRWSVTLDPLPASAEGRPLIIAGKNEIRLNDVLVGEVWLASGQSNMALRIKQIDAKDAIATAGLPLLREFSVKNQLGEDPMETVGGDWIVSTPETVMNFSAVGFYFARELQENLKVPVGVIHSSWGGTPIVGWMSAKALASEPKFAVVGQRWAQTLEEYPAKKVGWDRDMAAWGQRKAAAEARSEPFTEEKPREPAGPGHRYSPGGLYNGKISPLAPYALRGVIWYQGEHDVGRWSEYRDWFPALIRDWRTLFAQGNIPFYWVQLPNFGHGSSAQGTNWAFMREAQAASLALPETGQAVTIDVGDPADIHPTNKGPVGHRLALLALARTYGCNNIMDTGPVFSGVLFEGATARVRFEPSSSALKTTEGSPRGFELAGADQKFHPAEARIEGDAVVATSSAVPAPVAVRYAWRNAPEATLYNAAGLPAAPFRSDDW